MTSHCYKLLLGWMYVVSMDDVWHIDQWGRMYNRYAMVARDLSSITTPSPSGCALRFGVVIDDKFLQPWYNYYFYNFLWYMKQNLQLRHIIWKPTCYYRNKGEVENIVMYK